MTVAEAVSDLELRLTGGKPSDDQPVWWPQLRQWLFIARNEILSAWISKFIDIPALVIKEYNCLLVEADQPETICGCLARYYIPLPTVVTELGDTLPVEVMSLDRNMGIVDVFIGEGRIERAVTRSEARMLLDQGADELFYPVGSRIYLLGGSYPAMTRAHLALIPASAEAFADDDPFPAPAEIHKSILDAAEEIGSRQIGKPQDITNDAQAAPASL
jgi:hypothetical protein